MSVFQVKPLEDRTGFKGNPKRSPFKSYWASTLQLLERELAHLRAENVIVEVDCLPGAIRLDGQLYANAKVNSPAVRLHFDTDDGHLNFPTDAFNTWQDNIRAIALGLEALRKIERYGIGRGDEQWRGFLALESGTGIALGGMTRDEAIRIIDDHQLGDWQLDGPGGARAYRIARAAVHPDRHDGDRTLWDDVETAAKVLGLS